MAVYISVILLRRRCNYSENRNIYRRQSRPYRPELATIADQQCALGSVNLLQSARCRLYKNRFSSVHIRVSIAALDVSLSLQIIQFRLISATCETRAYVVFCQWRIQTFHWGGGHEGRAYYNAVPNIY